MASQLISRLKLHAEILHLQRSMLAADLLSGKLATKEIGTLDSKLLYFHIKINVVDDTEESCTS